MPAPRSSSLLRLAGLVVGGSVAAEWTADDRFSYRTTLADGSTRTILVDPIKKTRTVCNRRLSCHATGAGAGRRRG
jgi:hypothetical protein